MTPEEKAAVVKLALTWKADGESLRDIRMTLDTYDYTDPERDEIIEAIKTIPAGKKREARPTDPVTAMPATIETEEWLRLRCNPDYAFSSHCRCKRIRAIPGHAAGELLKPHYNMGKTYYRLPGVINSKTGKRSSGQPTAFLAADAGFIAFQPRKAKS